MIFDDRVYGSMYDPNECPCWNSSHRAIVHALESHQGQGRSQIMAALEERVRLQFGLGLGTQIDWSEEGLSKMKMVDGATSPNWQAILAFILQYLPTLLAILFGGS